MSWDLNLLIWINQTAAVSWLDEPFILITNLHKLDVVRFGLFPALLFFLFWKYRLYAVKAIFSVVLVTAVTDSLNHRVIKPYFDRDRPFISYPNEVQLKLSYKPGGHSFPSNHAFNGMAGARLLSAFFPGGSIFFYSYTALVGYSRPYLGVHFPSDILVGWMLGFALSSGLIGLLRKFYPKWFKR